MIMLSIHRIPRWLQPPGRSQRVHLLSSACVTPCRSTGAAAKRALLVRCDQHPPLRSLWVQRRDSPPNNNVTTSSDEKLSNGLGRLRRNSISSSETPRDDDYDGNDEATFTSNRVYVGGLSWSTSEEDLERHIRDAVAPEGHEVRRARVFRYRDGRSKGCGVVGLASVEGAQKAVEVLSDSSVLDGRRVFVREDREAEGHNASVKPVEPGTKLFVGNLHREADWRDLRDHFRAVAEVEWADVVASQDGERSRGVGYVRFRTAADARRAIEELDGKELKGKPLKVRLEGGRVSRREIEPGSKLFVGNLPQEASWQDLKDHFRPVAEVAFAEVVARTDQRTKRRTSRGFAYVRFDTAEDAKRAIEELDGAELMGSPLEVRLDDRLDSENA